MTAGNDLVSNEVVINKVEDSLDVSNVNGNGDCDRGGGDGKDESDDSSYVFVSDGGVDVVSKSDSVEEVDLFKKEENGGISVGDQLDLETNDVENEVKDVTQEACLENGSVVNVNESAESNGVDLDVKGLVGKAIQEETVEDGNEIADVEAKTDDLVSAVGSDTECIRDPIEGSESQDTVSQSVSLPDVTNTTDGNEIHDVDDAECIRDPVERSESQDTVSQSVSLPDVTNTIDGNENYDVEAKREDVVSAVDSDAECIQNPVESSESQVTISQSVSTPDIVNEVATPIPVENTNGEVMVFDGPESVSDMVEEAECEVIADGSGKLFENLECQVAVNGLVSSGSSIKEKSEVTVDESRNPSDDLECQVTTDGQEASGSSMKEEEAQVTADEPESSGRSMKEQEAQVTVDESGNPSEDLESQATADGLKSCGSAIKEQDSEVSVGNVLDNQECPVSVDESEPTGNPTEEVDDSSIVMESNGKPEEEHELLSKALEVNVEPELNHVCNGMRSGHVNESLSASHQFEDKKFEGASATESTEYPDSGAVMSVYADDLANRQVVNFDGTLENGEIHISGTEADESVPLRFDGELAKPEEKFEKQAEESSETLVEVTESVEIMANSEELKEQVKKEDEIQQSQILATDNVQGYLNLEDKTAESANEAEVPSETETNIEPVSHDNTRSQSEVSNCSDKPQEGFQTDGSAEIVVTSDPVKSECNNEDLLAEKDNDALSNHEDLTVVEEKVQIVAHLGTENESAEDMGCGTGTETADVLDDNEKETEDKDAPVELVADLVKENCSADSGTEIENVDVPDDPEKETLATDVPVADHSTLSFPDTPVAVIEFGSIGRHETLPSICKIDMISSSDAPNGDAKFACGNDSGIPEQNVDGSHGDRNSDKMSCPEVEDMDVSDEIPTSSVDGSVSDAVRDEEVEVRAYNFLIRIPRFEDESFREQIIDAQLLVKEKTDLRDAIRDQIIKIRDVLRSHNEAYKAARLEETAARRLVKLKRQEIDSVQDEINRLKNAMSVEDIDGRMLSLEHMIQHETLVLKDEKQFIREIKQLKALRDQLAKNMGTPEEVRQAIDKKDENEELMKTLRKELDSLKSKVSKAEAVVNAVGKKYDEDSRRERELQAQFRAADDVRQKAYAHLNSLKRLAYDKNKNFRLYKEDLSAARKFKSRGDKDALHRLCANQVEAFMERWNNNDEFRQEYVSRCNMNAARRQRALGGGSLVPDDGSPMLPIKVNEKVDNSLISTPSQMTSVSGVSAVGQGNIVSSTESKHAEINNKSIENVSSQKNQDLKTKAPAKSSLVSDVASINGFPVVNKSIDDKKEEESTLTKVEIELAQKAEELKNEEIAAQLKEQRRLEEKAKAAEALERKKRNAEKAQMRAELRARKEAEQKEKEKEKRLRKKEKKKAGDGSINGEEPASSESSNEATTKEIETLVKENAKKKTQKPPAHFFSKQLKPKPIPPPIINRNKKRWQMWGNVALAVVATIAAIALLYVLSTGRLLDFRVPKAKGAF
uniref:uncharacterized protein LOC122585759 n=1 Tax=Erigeron canadensis TaxID=72917 RepID=UPI001CB97A33|nr:uncharacterized protein LOC122585759 [Erigeron canadensis]